MPPSRRAPAPRGPLCWRCCGSRRAAPAAADSPGAGTQKPPAGRQGDARRFGRLRKGPVPAFLACTVKFARLPVPSTSGCPTKAQPARLAAKTSSLARIWYTALRPVDEHRPHRPFQTAGASAQEGEHRAPLEVHPALPQRDGKQNPAVSKSARAAPDGERLRGADFLGRSAVERGAEHCRKPVPRHRRRTDQQQSFPHANPPLHNGGEMIRRRADAAKQRLRQSEALGLHPRRSVPVLAAHVNPAEEH